MCAKYCGGGLDKKKNVETPAGRTGFASVSTQEAGVECLEGMREVELE